MTGRHPRYAFAAALLAGVWPHFPAVPVNAHEIAANGTDAAEQAIAEASLRFGLPADWIRAVMQAESGGDAQAVSRAGAIGLMQLMPGTYAELRARYGLGPDPFRVRDNIMAGTAYLRELHDLYGPVGMLAAYNAGPGRWEDHVRAGRALPAETQLYLAKLGSVLGLSTAGRPALAAETAAGSSRTETLFVVRTVAARVTDSTRGGALSAPDPAPAPRREMAETVFVFGIGPAAWRQSDGAISDSGPTRGHLGAPTTADPIHPRPAHFMPPDARMFVGHHPDGPTP